MRCTHAFAESAKSRLGPRGVGLTLALLGALAVTPDALLVRLASELGGSTWLIVMFKGFALAGINLALSAMQNGLAGLPARICAGPGYILLCSLFQTGLNIGFPLALLETSAASALLLIALNPLWAALLGRVLLGDRLRWYTVAALVIAAVAVGIVFLPTLLDATDGDGGGDGGGDREADTRGNSAARSETLHGSLIALATGICLASSITANRYGAKKAPEAAISFAGVIGATVAGLVAVPLALTQSPRFGDIDPRFFPVVLLDSLCIATVIQLALVLAARFITSAEVALVLLIENLFGPLWVFLGVGEVPSVYTFVGGGILLCTLAGHELVRIRLTRTTRKTAAPTAPTMEQSEKSDADEGAEEKHRCDDDTPVRRTPTATSASTLTASSGLPSRSASAVGL